MITQQYVLVYCIIIDLSTMQAQNIVHPATSPLLQFKTEGRADSAPTTL